MPDSLLRLALVTNIPTPYRVPVFDRVAAAPGIALRVLYAALREPDRDWDLPPLRHDHVVLTTGNHPTHLAAFAYARVHGAARVAMIDGRRPQASWRRRGRRSFGARRPAASTKTRPDARS